MLGPVRQITIRATRAMRYAAALTVQATNCSFWPGKKVKQLWLC